MLSLKLPQMLVSAPRHPASAAGALLKKVFPPQKGRPQIGGDLAKIAFPAQRRAEPKPPIFERNHR
jgi:hypothetical protein